MGNNIVYSTFEYAIIRIYNHGVLSLELLDDLASDYEGMDIDSGGSRDMQSNDGKSLEDICIGLVDPTWFPIKGNDEDYIDPAFWKYEELYKKWESICTERWKWG